MGKPAELSQALPFQDSLQLVVTCASGFESLLLEELQTLFPADKELLSSLKISSASVKLEATLAQSYRICLWSRIAEQVLLQLASINITEKDQDLAREQLYKNVKKIPWERVFSVEQSFVVENSGKQTVFDDTRFASLVVKDAIVDRFRFHYEKRPDVSKDAAVRINLFVDESQFEIQLNLSGERLHRRAYRQESVEAPLRETLAAALLMQLNWHKEFETYQYFLDPCCGSGTLVIEALLMALDVAPGLLRLDKHEEAFSFLHFKTVNENAWQSLITEAEERRRQGSLRADKLDLKFRAYDSDIAALSVLRNSLERLGLDKLVHVEKRHLFQLKAPGTNDEKGLLIANPPYGERLQEGEGLKHLYRFIGEQLRTCFSSWKAGVICNDVELLDALGMSEFQQMRCYNGNLKCLFRYFDVPTTEPETQDTKLTNNRFVDRVDNLKSTSQIEQLEFDQEADAFKNRLLKNLKSLKPWILENNIEHFRLYDCDIPEFKVSVDCYQGKNSDFVLVYEYAPPKTVDENAARHRFNLVLKTLRTLFGLQREQVYIKTRRQQKGNLQYKPNQQKRGRLLSVQENGLNFLINPTDYLDTGLFLDHRLMRKIILQECRGKRFLNLFAYTGSATVYALAGGAKSSCSVDLSDNYLSWAKNNLLANGFDTSKQSFVKSDAIKWLSSSKDQFDVIFIDPPTFSNSKKKQLLFDVQSDHEKLIDLAMARLDGQGTLYFSNNFRKFELSPSLNKKYNLEEITRVTLSKDFSRSAKHRSWKIQKRS